MDKLNEYQDDNETMKQFKNSIIQQYMDEDKTLSYENAEKLYFELMSQPMTEGMKKCRENIEREFKEIENMSHEELIKKFKEEFEEFKDVDL